MTIIFLRSKANSSQVEFTLGWFKSNLKEIAAKVIPFAFGFHRSVKSFAIHYNKGSWS